MKFGQSVITFTWKDSGQSYLFGSLSAIYGMFNSEQLGITYSALRNAVATYINNNHIDESQLFLQTIYDHKSSSFTLQRSPLLLLERKRLDSPLI